MASDEAIAKTVTALYTSANCTAGKAEQELFRTSFEDVTDEELREATRHVLRTEHWDFGRKPSPALLHDGLHNVRARSAARTRTREEPGEVTPRDQLAARVAAVRGTALVKGMP